VAVDQASQAETGAAPIVENNRKVMLVFAGVMLGMFLAALDQTIVATALPTIVGDLGGANHLSWVVTAYMLASTATTPLWGKLGDMFGPQDHLPDQRRDLPDRLGAVRPGAQHGAS
jgi:MFS family permease